jgi:uncharacterized tellurite resistance protein B-like protein
VFYSSGQKGGVNEAKWEIPDNKENSMFESLKHWFENLPHADHLFEHPEAEQIHVALASVLYHVIAADQLESSNEKKKFQEILANEFDMTGDQISTLYGYVKTLKSDLKTDLKTVEEYLKHNPALRMTFMVKLNQLICVDGTKNDEIEIFYEAMKVIFPDIDNPNST